MYYTIYKITHLPSGKIYIGKHQTENPQDDYMGSGKLISYAIEKYGRDQFRKDVMHIFDNEQDMNTKEAELVTEEFCSQDTNYNLCPGGHGGWGYVNSNNKRNGIENWSFSQRQQASKFGNMGLELKRKDPTWDREYRNKLSKAAIGRQTFLGKSHSEETKEKMRKSKNVGESNSQFGTMWITNGEEAKKIKKSQSIPEGWRKGRK